MNTRQDVDLIKYLKLQNLEYHKQLRQLNQAILKKNKRIALLERRLASSKRLAGLYYRFSVRLAGKEREYVDEN